jgi:mRNA-degrading endonuclease RelE of RelBE toxin-antitoxin system
MAKYSVEIKPSAVKELDALEDLTFARIDRKIIALSENPGPPAARSSKATRTRGASALVTGALFTSLTTRPNS